jgi:DNA-binding transcriptional MocR family regulator
MIFVPGSVFSPGGGDTATLRLSFSAGSPEELSEGVRRLRRAHLQYLK